MIFLGIGSNLGDRERNIGAALHQLKEKEDICIEAISSLYETEPVGLKEQPAFLNCVIGVVSKLEPYALLDRCLSIEKSLGRIRTKHWGPRTIDIDILYYKGLEIDEDRLQIPHPRLAERNFVLIPLAEIANELVICNGFTARQLFEKSQDNCVVQRYQPISRVLLMSAPIGAGHVRAAQIVGRAMQKENPALDIRHVNVFDLFHPIIGQAILKIYLTILDIIPQAYGMIYGWGNNSKSALTGRKLISRYLGKRMQNYLNEFCPQLIICTHATPAGLVAHLLSEGTINIPAVAIVTDFVVHRLWIYPEISCYYVANESMRNTLEQSGVSQENVVISGIPVGEEFSIPLDKEQALLRLGLQKDCKTVLVMGGGAGVLPMVDILQTLQEIDAHLQVVMITGTNKNLYQKLLQQKKMGDCAVSILGFVDNVHQWMAVADLIITKPGGMTSAESLCCGLPMIIYCPIPGQEEGNTRHLLECGAAVRADSQSHLRSVLQDVLSNHSTNLQQMREAALLHRRCDAVQQIVESIISRFYS